MYVKNKLTIIPSEPGIYKIINKFNNKIYIGSTTNLKKRKNEHFYKLKKQKHDNVLLQSSFNKYGIDNFSYQIILLCDIKHLLFFEQRFLNYYFDNQNKCLNICPTAGNCLGRKFSKETKSKMSKKRKGLLKGDKHPFYGRKLPVDIKKKLSKANKGRKQTEEEIENRRKSLKKNWNNNIKRKLEQSARMTGDKNPFYGKKHSKEMRKKISEHRKGKMLGKKHPMYDHAIYYFLNEKIGIEEKCTREEFRKKHNLKKESVASLIRKERNSLFGWIVVGKIP